MPGLLEGRKILVLGVANKRSIAWASAQAAAREGARLILTYQERVKEGVEELASSIPGARALPCEVTQDASVETLFRDVGKSWGCLDGLIHSIAFAPAADLERAFVETSREGCQVAVDVSAYSLPLLARFARPLLEGSGGASIVAYTYLGSERVVPGYNVMGIAKAALEASVRYLAYDLGVAKVRVNGISAGPVNTLSARGVSGFTKILDVVKDRAPLRRNIEASEVADATVFLLSPMSRGITGEILHVDAGYHCMGL
ncbi:MAG: enoyl-ACP reductase [Planctomycetes bacterium]|nr:enoyl-ACP reductase [Planctomycetota bacterium]